MKHHPTSRRSAASQSYDEGVAAAERVLQAAKTAVKAKADAAGDADAAQHVMHGYAWLATYVEALRQLRGWGAGSRTKAVPGRWSS